MAQPRPVRLAATLALLAFVSIYGGGVFENILHGISPAWAPPVLALAPILYLLVTRTIRSTDGLGPRATPVILFLTGVAAPVFAAHAHMALTFPIVKLRDGRDATFIDACLILLVATVAAVVVTGLVARVLQRRGLASTAVFLRIAAPIATALAIVLVIACALSPRPAVDRWLGQLPIVASVPPMGPNSDFEVGDLVLRRWCHDHGCRFWVFHRGEQEERTSDLETRESVELRRDAAHDLWILDDSGGAAARFIDQPARVAFRGDTLERTEVRPSTLIGSLAPPRGWIVTAAIGAVLALASFVHRRGARKRLEAILAAEAGTLDEDGWITLDRGSSWRHGGTGIPPGPVLVVLPAAVAGSTYRSEAARPAQGVLAGTRADLAEQARVELARLDAKALVAATVAAAPLAMAFLEGLR